MAAQGRGARSLEKDSCLGSEYINLNQIARRTTMAEDLNLPKDVGLGKDAEPANAMEVSKDLTLPDGRQAPFRVECNVYDDISLFVPAPDPSFPFCQQIPLRVENHLFNSVPV